MPNQAGNISPSLSFSLAFIESCLSTFFFSKYFNLPVQHFMPHDVPRSMLLLTDYSCYTAFVLQCTTELITTKCYYNTVA